MNTTNRPIKVSHKALIKELTHEAIDFIEDLWPALLIVVPITLFTLHLILVVTCDLLIK